MPVETNMLLRLKYTTSASMMKMNIVVFLSASLVFYFGMILRKECFSIMKIAE